LRRPARYLNPGVPDEERSLARRGTTLVGSVKSGVLIEMVDRGRWWDEAAAEARRITRRTIERSVAPWSRRSAGIVTAILIGDRAGLDEAVERRLQEAGTYHVIAISGGNIAILAGLGLAAFRVAGCLGRTAMLSAIAALLSYGYLVGSSASVRRATLMAVLYFAARAIDLRGPPINVLASCAGLLVAAQPLDILDPGFLLTFGATFAILLAVPAWPPRSLPSSIVPLASMLAATIAAEAMLLPISALFFSRVTFAGLVLNFAAIPLMGIVQIAGLVTVGAAAFSATCSSMAGWIAHIAAEGLVRSADLVELVPLPAWRVPSPGWPVVGLYYAALAAAWTLWRVDDRHSILRKARWGALALSLTAAVWMVARPWLPVGHSGLSARGRLRITFIDVGQGDSALVQFPRGDTMLVDAGGLPGATSFDIGDRVVAPVLRHSGIRRLDTLMVTHGDLDHAGGMFSVVREFRPRDVWEGIPVPPLAVLRDLRSTIDTGGGRWVNVQAGDLVSIGEVAVLIRHPRLADWERQDVRNDDSIVVELLWKDVSVVLTGDIGREVERELAASFLPSPMRVLKVAHHGSLTSSSREFVRALAPKVAVISVGRGNAFGHPAPAVLATYRDAGAHIFRTDQDGAITVETDGHSLDVRTFTGQRLIVRPEPRKHETTKGT
jgi:competence protein ComEC